MRTASVRERRRPRLHDFGGGSRRPGAMAFTLYRDPPDIFFLQPCSALISTAGEVGAGELLPTGSMVTANPCIELMPSPG